MTQPWELQRCISNFVPMNAVFRRLRATRTFVLDGVCLQLVPDAPSLEELRRFCGKYSLLSLFTPSGKLRKHCSHGLGRRGGPHSKCCQRLGVQHRWGPRALEVSSSGFLSLITPHSLIRVDGLDVVGSSSAPANGTPSFIHRLRLALWSPQASASRWGKRVVRTSSARTWTELVVSFAMHGRKSSPWSSPFSRSWFVLGGPYLPCSTAWACVRPHLGVASILFLSRSVQRGLDMNPCLHRGRIRLLSSSPSSWSPWACASFAGPLVAPTRRMQERVRRRRLLVFPQVQSSPEAAAAEADDGSVQVVVGDSALYWYDSCSATSFLTFPLSLPSTLLFDCVRCHSSGFMPVWWRLPNLS